MFKSGGNWERVIDVDLVNGQPSPDRLKRIPRQDLAKELQNLLVKLDEFRVLLVRQHSPSQEGEAHGSAAGRLTIEVQELAKMKAMMERSILTLTQSSPQSDDWTILQMLRDLFGVIGGFFSDDGEKIEEEPFYDNDEVVTKRENFRNASYVVLSSLAEARELLIISITSQKTAGEAGDRETDHLSTSEEPTLSFYLSVEGLQSSPTRSPTIGTSSSVPASQNTLKSSASPVDPFDLACLLSLSPGQQQAAARGIDAKLSSLSNDGGSFTVPGSSASMAGSEFTLSHVSRPGTAVSEEELVKGVGQELKEASKLLKEASNASSLF